MEERRSLWGSGFRKVTCKNQSLKIECLQKNYLNIRVFL